ncbi:unnamed protein product [Thelazia callipaeda]|uniref:Major sperm protein n=1 Tax=Thelazia callipaeda TaxID=103827 RepID=A0A0N5D4Z9_THECL|nr:unnamed protein product [Thelazia callipaeda]
MKGEVDISKNTGTEYVPKSGDIMSNSSASPETTFAALTTLPGENNIVVASKCMSKYNCTELSTAQLWLSETAKTTNIKNYEAKDSCQLLDIKRSPRKIAKNGLVSSPESQIVFRSDYIGPAILSLTNYYKKPVIWVLKTSAAKCIVAFPHFGCIPPMKTVQIKLDLVQPMSIKNSKDQITMEYIVGEQNARDDNISGMFKKERFVSKKKNLEIVYA